MKLPKFVTTLIKFYAKMRFSTIWSIALILQNNFVPIVAKNFSQDTLQIAPIL